MFVGNAVGVSGMLFGGNAVGVIGMCLLLFVWVYKVSLLSLLLCVVIDLH